MEKTNIDNIRHSLAHVLAAVVLKKYPKTKLGIGPVIENGFYYDFLFVSPITEADLKDLEKDMKRLIAGRLPFSGEKITPLKAKKFFKGQKFKLDLIKEFSKDKKPLTLYHTGDVFTDLCRGGHVDNTSEINIDGFKLTHIAGAYWRGNEKNPMLTRIYALAFNSKAELDAHLAMLEDAKKRAHRKLGKELKLFTVIDEIGAGLPLFYPNGAIVRRLIENMIIEMQEKRGYQPIWIPHITKSDLYKISGHLDKYDAMYPPMRVDEDDYYLKPMNCPHFMMLYNTEPHSYRDLPLRYTATTTNYRLEKSGELLGLTRVRSLTQDDCHVFCTEDQIANEIGIMVEMIMEVYKKFEFKNYYVRISTSDPTHQEKYIGDKKTWADAEKTLIKIVTDKKIAHVMGLGEAAFYGPKLDFMVKDAIGREWQLSTIQLDYNLPQRFNCEYTDSDGSKKRPVIIHRAILGSTERFMGILIEHTAGLFPFWLSPVQIKIIPVSEKHNEYAQKVAEQLNTYRVEVASENETLGKKIRSSEMQKIPYLLIVGDKEIAEQTVAVRKHGKGDLGAMNIEDFKDLLQKNS